MQCAYCIGNLSVECRVGCSRNELDIDVAPSEQTTQ